MRDANGVFSINYKNWHRDADGWGRYCDEYESPIGDIARMRKILQVLDFKALVAVDKVRKVWVWGNYEIAIDTVKDLGGFVEVEYVGATAVNPDEIIAEMVAFLKRLGCGEIWRNNGGYPFQILFGDEVKREVM